MKRLLQDLLLLVTICGATWGLLQIRAGSNRRVEFNHGEVYYSPAISFDEALKCASYMVQVGAFDGSPKTVQMSRREGVYQLKMVVSSAFAKDPNARQQAHAFARKVCEQLFKGLPAEIHLADADLQSIDMIYGTGPVD